MMQAVSEETEIPEAKAVRIPIAIPPPSSASGLRGQNMVQDIKREMPDFAPSIIFDVGANIGDRSTEYASQFPDASVYCFEPVATTYFDLKRNVAALANCQCVQLGFGDEAGTVDMLSNLAHPNRSHVLPADCDPLVATASTAIVQAKMETIDRFCAEAGIGQIDLLKIDTEGFDMKVLLGARGMLEQGSIRFIVVEAGMYAGNTHHVPFMDLWNYLDGFGFVLFGIYDQCREWTKNLPYLRRADLSFIRK